ncbi:hypothetical protein KFU94_41375 [Chloroflexi bacterium TSY]|nr:hypothetical protein [Chloroflexi bacterium TSY]
MKKLLKLAMIGLMLVGGRRYMQKKFDPYGHHSAYGYNMGSPAMGYMPYKARKRMKRKMQKRMLKHTLRQIF